MATRKSGKKPTLSPAEKAQKDVLKNLTQNERKTFMEGVEKRLEAQKPKPKPTPKPKRKTVRSRAAEAAKESAKNAEAKANQKMGAAKKKAAKKVSGAASRTAQSAGKTAAKAGEATVKGASKAGSALGTAKAAGKALGKVAAPVAVVGEGVNVANLLLNEDARQEARDYVKGMEDDNILMRAGKSFLSPTDTIFGATSAGVDAMKSMVGGNRAMLESIDLAQRMGQKWGDNASKEAARNAVISSILNPDQARELERAVVQSPELLKDYSAIQNPEQAKALYATVSKSAEPTVEDVVDRRLEPAPAATPAPAAAPAPAATPAPAEAPTSEELREAADPDMKMMFGTEATPAEPEVDFTDQAVDLFKNTHGTEFDPKSKMDREKLEKMKSMLAKQGGLGDMSANQFALQVYRNS